MLLNKIESSTSEAETHKHRRPTTFSDMLGECLLDATGHNKTSS